MSADSGTRATASSRTRRRIVLLVGLVIVPVAIGCGVLQRAPTSATAAVTRTQRVVPGEPLAFGIAGAYSTGPLNAVRGRVVAMAADPDGTGCWVVSAEGSVQTEGGSPFFGSLIGRRLPSPVVAIAATSNGRGYWLATANGSVYSFGDARAEPREFHQSMRGGIAAIVATRDGSGYWLVSPSGAVYPFGDARVYQASGTALDSSAGPIIGMAPTVDGRGYWLASAEGQLFSFGSAASLRGVAPQALDAPVTAIAPAGSGFFLLSADGQLFGFAGARVVGSMAATPFAGRAVAIATTDDGAGYWIVAAALPPQTSVSSWAGRALWYLDDEPNSTFHEGERVVALSFDDGPSPVYTPEILSVLMAEHVKASFQIIGEEGASYPYLLREEVADGMTLVSHTWTHPDLEGLSAAALSSEIDRTNQLLEQETDKAVTCLRPPYGDTNATVLAALRARGMAELMWDVDPSDYLRPGVSAIVDRVLSTVQANSIVVLHDGGGDRSQTVAALPAIIAGLRARGYRIVPACA